MLRKRPCRFLWQCWLSQTIVEALHKSSVLLFVCKKNPKKQKEPHMWLYKRLPCSAS